MAIAYKLFWLGLGINLGIEIANLIAQLIFPSPPYTMVRLVPQIIDIPYLNNLGNIPALLASSVLITIIAFSLVPITIAFVVGLFTASSILIIYYINIIPMPIIFKIIFSTVVGLLTVVGIIEWAGKGKL